jgi:hypothetical protein
MARHRTIDHIASRREPAPVRVTDGRQTPQSIGDCCGAEPIQINDDGVLLFSVTCSKCGFDGHNSRTCEGPHRPCPTCGKPTANMNDYSERHDDSYCSPFTSSECWG